MIILHVTYTLKENNAKEFTDALEASGIPELCRQEEGNIRYDYFHSAAESNRVLLVEVWKDAEALRLHHEMEHFSKIGALKDPYVLHTEVQRFTAEEFK